MRGGRLGAARRALRAGGAFLPVLGRVGAAIGQAMELGQALEELGRSFTALRESSAPPPEVEPPAGHYGSRDAAHPDVRPEDFLPEALPAGPPEAPPAPEVPEAPQPLSAPDADYAGPGAPPPEPAADLSQPAPEAPPEPALPPDVRAGVEEALEENRGRWQAGLARGVEDLPLLATIEQQEAMLGRGEGPAAPPTPPGPAAAPPTAAVPAFAAVEAPPAFAPPGPGAAAPEVPAPPLLAGPGEGEAAPGGPAAGRGEEEGRLTEAVERLTQVVERLAGDLERAEGPEGPAQGPAAQQARAPGLPLDRTGPGARSVPGAQPAEGRKGGQDVDRTMETARRAFDVAKLAAMAAS